MAHAGAGVQRDNPAFALHGILGRGKELPARSVKSTFRHLRAGKLHRVDQLRIKGPGGRGFPSQLDRSTLQTDGQDRQGLLTLHMQQGGRPRRHLASWRRPSQGQSGRSRRHHRFRGTHGMETRHPALPFRHDFAMQRDGSGSQLVQGCPERLRLRISVRIRQDQRPA